MKPALIVALDVPSVRQMEHVLDQMPDSIEWYKVGMELFSAEGPAALAPLRNRNKKIFLDLKFHDIPRTVYGAVSAAAGLGVNLMTVHASGGREMLEAAAEAARKSVRPPLLVAVTTLTSLSQNDLAAAGIVRSVEEQALSLGELAVSSGINGLVTSAQEAAVLRKKFPDALLVTPGIRMPNTATGDQKRIATPAFAVKQGASLLVAGRPVLEASNPFDAAVTLVKEINKASPESTGF